MGPLPHRQFVSASRSKLPSFLASRLDSPSANFGEKVASLTLLLLLYWSNISKVRLFLPLRAKPNPSLSACEFNFLSDLENN